VPKAAIAAAETMMSEATIAAAETMTSSDIELRRRIEVVQIGT
jgi:hypothetical protein